MERNYQYYLFHKPYGVLSQFTKEVKNHITLADYLVVPKDVYPIGRLDKDSEGLLLLTNDNTLKNRLLDPKNKKYKTYHVQVEGKISKEAIEQLASGVFIKLNKFKYKTLPARVKKIESHIHPERKPPIRKRPNIPTTWLEIKIHEGKNRQIRKMCSSVGFPVLRLIRVAISDLDIFIEVGKYVELDKRQIGSL